jgi:hypothetical protein
MVQHSFSRTLFLCSPGFLAGTGLDLTPYTPQARSGTAAFTRNLKISRTQRSPPYAGIT